MKLLILALCLGGVPAFGDKIDFVTADDLDAQAARANQAIKSCGPVAACYCLRKLGRPITLREVFDHAKMGDEGTSVSDLLDLLGSFGQPGQVVVGGQGDLELLPSPAILLVGKSHCIVYEALEEGGKSVRYFEPSDGSIRVVPREALNRDWKGEAIVFAEPSLTWPSFLGWIMLSALSVLAGFYLLAHLSSIVKGQIIARRASS